MSELATLSAELSDGDWLSEIAKIGDERGYFLQLGKRHSALFLDESLDTLLVTFDTVASARNGSASGIPHGMLQAEINGWSLLSLIARRSSWFRSKKVYSYFDQLVDEAFFEDFEQVIFYGAGANGYAAAAYSVTAPGSRVLLVSPQATLDPEVAPWDDRFVTMRRTDFSSRYGYAPDMIEGAEEVILFYDPAEELDAMHAALFRGPQVRKIRFRQGGATTGKLLQDLKVVGQVLRGMADGNLTEQNIYWLLRRRRNSLAYLSNLLNRVHIEDREYLVALLARWVLEKKENSKFRHHLSTAERKLTDQGRRLPRRLSKRQGSTRRLPELRDN